MGVKKIIYSVIVALAAMIGSMSNASAQWVVTDPGAYVNMGLTTAQAAATVKTLADYSKKFKDLYRAVEKIQRYKEIAIGTKECGEILYRISQRGSFFPEFVQSGCFTENELEAVYAYYQVMSEDAIKQFNIVKACFKDEAFKQNMSIKDLLDIVNQTRDRLLAIQYSMTRLNSATYGTMRHRVSTQRNIQRHCSFY